jgi:undecaprenyl-diphosphatase
VLVNAGLATPVSKVGWRQVLAASFVAVGSSSSNLALAAEPLLPPRPVEEPPARITFFADPVADGALLSFATGTAVLSEAILGTGEITPQQPQDPSRLLGIDRPVIDITPEPAWRTVSSVGLFSAVAFAAIDPIATGFRNDAEAAIVDAVIYSETITITWSMTNLAKIAFRRPRPTAYREQQRRQAITAPDTPPDITQTDSALSFYSGHG